MYLADGVIVWHILGKERDIELLSQLYFALKYLQHHIQHPVGVQVKATYNMQQGSSL